MANGCTRAAVLFTIQELQAQGVNVNPQELVVQEQAGDLVTTIRVFDRDNPNKWKGEGLVAKFNTGTFQEFNPKNVKSYPPGIYNK
jgi:hypothetical protein